MPGLLFFMLSESVISVHMQCTFFMIALACLCLPSWDFLILTQCNVMDILCNNKDAVYYYHTTLWTAYIQVCFCLNMFQIGCTRYDYSLHTQPDTYGHGQLPHNIWLYWSMLIYTYVHACNQNGGGSTNSYHYTIFGI